ncbi:MAG: C10 family peptidase [Armatimonadota bacterium]|nr:C10 family peptidase [Armatimonadota bacterium]
MGILFRTPSRMLTLLTCLLLLPTYGTAGPVDSDAAFNVTRNWLANNPAPMRAEAGAAAWTPGDVRPFEDADGGLLAHVVDLNPRGFVVVPADDVIEPILCFGTETDFSEPFGPPEALSDMLQRDIPHRLANRDKLSPECRGKVARRWSRLRDDAASARTSYASTVTPAVEPFIQDTWGQGDKVAPYTYELYSPSHYFTGCVATAMGMIIHYFRFPPEAAWSGNFLVDGVVQAGSFNDTFNYDLMPTRITGSSSQAEIEEVAKLLRDCGYSVGMMYSLASSGAYPGDIPVSLVNVFHYATARYQPAYADEWIALLKTEMDDRRPVYLSITSYSAGISHGIVCDGWGTEEGLDRFHVNMGWDGYGNGWYSIPVFTAGYSWDVLNGLVCDIRTPEGLQVPDPYFYPNGGVYTSPHTIYVYYAEGSTAHYRLDGKDPTELDPIVTDNALLIDRSCSLTVRAFQEYWIPSNVVRADFTIRPPCAFRVNDDAPGPGHDGTSWQSAFLSIHDAVGAAVVGDEIWVASGTYLENVNMIAGISMYGGFAGNETARSERNWRNNVTVIDGSAGDNTILAICEYGYPTVTSRIDGFIVCNGGGNGIHFIGGDGIDSLFVVSNCTVTQHHGCGIFCSDADLTIANNVVSNNEDFGVWVELGELDARNNLITGNGDFGVKVLACDATLTNNTVVSNVGGIHITAEYHTVSNVWLYNNIFAFNSYGIRTGTADSEVLFNNCVYGNKNYNYSGLSPGTGDIQVDPKFVSRSLGDYHIQSGSPCKDTGYDAAVAPSDLDVDAQARIYGAHVDIGADEWTPTAPVIRSFSPGTGDIPCDSKLTFSGVFYDANGRADLSRCYLLINDALDGKGAFVRYDYNSNRLYIRNDAGTGWIGGYSPGSAYTIENSYARLYCAETTKIGAGGTLTVNWKLTLKSTLSGKTCGAWLYVYDDGGLHDGWDKMADFTISGPVANQPPVDVSLSPNTGTIQSGGKMAFTTVYSDPDGCGNLQASYLLLNNVLAASNAAYFKYDAAADRLYLRNNTDTSWLGGYAPGTANTIENSFCRLYCAETTKSASANDLSLTWTILLKPITAGGSCSAWLSVYDIAGANDGWDKMGSYDVR